ncbi:hypothetical protein FBUS_07603, partial [Fasciolopsis buskii]
IQSAVFSDSTLSNSYLGCAVRQISTDKVDTRISWNLQTLRPTYSSVSSYSFQSRVRSAILSRQPANSYYYGTISKISG